MHLYFRATILSLLLWTCAAPAQVLEFRVAYEDKESADHAGTTVAVPDNPGVMVELVALVQAQLPGLRIKFTRKPWARCLAELEAGNVDAIFPSSFNLERMKVGVYPMKDGRDDRRYRLDTKSYSLYKLNESPLVWDGHRFEHMRQSLIAVRGYSIVEDLKRMGVAINEVNRPDDALRMLLAGRADGFAQLTEFGDYILKKNPEFARVVRAGPPIATKDYYLQISHQFYDKHPALAADIWKALAEARQTQSERLEAKYLKLAPN